MAEPELLVARDGPVAMVTFNRPEQRNALSLSVLEALRAFLLVAPREPDLRVIVLRGAGVRAFSAGFDHADLRVIQERGILISGPDDPFELALAALEQCPLPTIAMIQGYAVGGGLTLAAACDLRVGAESAKLGMPPAKLGILYSPNELRPFLVLLGQGRTRLLFYTGRIFDARAAYDFGLLDLLVPDEELEAATLALAREIAENAPLSVQNTKRTLLLMGQTRLTPGEQAEVRRMLEQTNTSADLREGQQAYAERRRPVFRGQ